MNRSAASAPFVPKGFQANPFAAPVTNDNCDLTTPPGSPRPLPYSINPSTPPGSPHPLPYSISPSTPPGSPHSSTVSPKSSITSTMPMEVAFQPSIVTCSSSGNSSPSLSRLALLFSIVLFSTHCHVSLQIATLLLHLLLCGIQLPPKFSSPLPSLVVSAFDSPSTLFVFVCHVLDACHWLILLLPVYISLSLFPSVPSFLRSLIPSSSCHVSQPLRKLFTMFLKPILKILWI